MEEHQKRTIGTVTTASASGGGLAGAVTIILVWVAEVNGMEIPAPVASAFTVLIGAVGALVGGWMVRPGNGRRAL